MENFKILGFHIYKLLVIIALISISECYPSFQNNIPNGNKVPNPCTADANDLWSAVGHWQPNNGGARNPFGRDFSRVGRVYTEYLHNMDSDGDGVSNGVELGLVWNSVTRSAEVNSTHSNPIGHPGICEPPQSQRCITLIRSQSPLGHPCPPTAPGGQSGLQSHGPIPVAQNFIQPQFPSPMFPQRPQFPMGQPQFAGIFGPPPPPTMPWAQQVMRQQIPGQQFPSNQVGRLTPTGAGQPFQRNQAGQQPTPINAGQQLQLNQRRQQPIPMNTGQQFPLNQGGQQPMPMNMFGVQPMLGK